MAVTFGTVEVIPAAGPSAATPVMPGVKPPAAPAGDPRELASVLRQLESREARVRAH